MADCKSLVACPFFNDKMANMPGLAASMKLKYCQGDPTQCARFMVSGAMGKDKVPADLFPHQVERAQEMIKIAGV